MLKLRHGLAAATLALIGAVAACGSQQAPTGITAHPAPAETHASNTGPVDPHSVVNGTVIQSLGSTYTPAMTGALVTVSAVMVTAPMQGAEFAQPAVRVTEKIDNTHGGTVFANGAIVDGGLTVGVAIDGTELVSTGHLTDPDILPGSTGTFTTTLTPEQKYGPVNPATGLGKLLPFDGKTVVVDGAHVQVRVDFNGQFSSIGAIHAYFTGALHAA